MRDVLVHRNSVAKWQKIGVMLAGVRAGHRDVSIACYPIGAIGYYSNARMIDMVGLTDAHIARRGVRLRGYVGHERADLDYVLTRKPDIIYADMVRETSEGRIVPSFYEFSSRAQSKLPYTEEQMLARIRESYDHHRIEGMGHFWVRRESAVQDAIARLAGATATITD